MYSNSRDGKYYWPTVSTPGLVAIVAVFTAICLNKSILNWASRLIDPDTAMLTQLYIIGYIRDLEQIRVTEILVSAVLWFVVGLMLFSVLQYFYDEGSSASRDVDILQHYVYPSRGSRRQFIRGILNILLLRCAGVVVTLSTLVGLIRLYQLSSTISVIGSSIITVGLYVLTLVVLGTVAYVLTLCLIFTARFLTTRV